MTDPVASPESAPAGAGLGVALQEGDPSPASTRTRWRLRSVTVFVAVVGLVLTGFLSWAASAANARSANSLLELQTREAATILTAALPSVQTQLSNALTVATSTHSPSTFEQYVARAVGHGLTSESLWQRTANGYAMVADAGATPQLVQDGKATTFFARIQPNAALQVTGFIAGTPPKIGYAEDPPGSPYIVYAESSVVANRHIAVPKNFAFNELEFALYLGRHPSPATLLAASATIMPGGPHAMVSVPFGTSAVTIVAAPRVPLTNGPSRALPWIAACIGTILALASAGIIEHLSRQRRVALELNDRLAGLYAEQRSISETLQHSLLPRRLPDIDGMQLAARYIPGAGGIDVGGDWYDVVVLDPNRFVFVVGDVSGRGVSAASVMASLRFASRAYALEGHAPGSILTHLRSSLSFDDEGHFATVLCGLVDVADHSLTLANAGHPPPVLANGEGAVVVAVPPSPPIGVAETTTKVVEKTIRVPAGSTLVAYTDGLIERRSEGLGDSLERLQRVAAADTNSLDDLVSHIVAEVTEGGMEDDLALIGMRWLA